MRTERIATLRVDTPQGFAGTLGNERGSYLFAYDPAAELPQAVSKLMPPRLGQYEAGGTLHPIFQMNLPEGFLLEQLRNRLAKVARVDPLLLLGPIENISGKGDAARVRGDHLPGPGRRRPHRSPARCRGARPRCRKRSAQR